MYRQKSFYNKKPTLYLVATPIGNLEEMTYRAVNILKEVDCIAAEDTRNTIKLLNHFDIKTKLISHHEHNLKTSIPKIIDYILEGNNLALVSDAGYPAISDPGYELVLEAIKKEINIVVVNGPNAGICSLVNSGILPQPFLFYGFLSHSDNKKRKELENLKNKEETIIFYESPHRYKKTLKLILDIFGDRNMSLARELTKKHEEIIRGYVSEILSIEEELKGEMVFVIEGAKHKEIVDNIDPKELVEKYILEGLTPKDAIKKVATDYSLSKNEVYKSYHQG